MPPRVFVTGCGMISSIGINFMEMTQSVLSGKSGIGPITILESIHKGKLLAGEINYSDKELAQKAGLDFIDGLTRTTILGTIAAREALASAKLTSFKDMALISGTTVGGMSSTEKYYTDFLSNDLRNAFIQSHDCGDSTERMALYIGINGYLATINTACSSAANAIMLGVRLIRNGKIERAVVGGVDALSKFTLNGFNTLMIVDQELCKPFDDSRNGLNLGEGAGYLVIESEKVLGKRIPLCEVKGFGNANDAFHQTASSPDGRGPFLSMLKALENGRLTPGDISYINAHGTATQNNDLSEGIAIERLFSKEVPYVSSTKSMTGHLLGASGAIEAGVSIISILNNIIPANLNFNTKMKELDFTPISEVKHGIEVNHVMSNSFGFGGNNTSLIFSKC